MFTSYSGRLYLIAVKVISTSELSDETAEVLLVQVSQVDLLPSVVQDYLSSF
ncbi:hypothetical protein HW132_06085 [Brasilonema sp. CT11]|nr:hypothetical protein [Brasilonema sp. CT11]